MFIKKRNLILALLLLGLISNTYGSKIVFGSTPTSIKSLLTPTLTLSCLVQDAPSNPSPSGALIGRDVSSSTPDNLLMVNSILLMRNDTFDVARVNSVTPAEAVGGLSNIKVTGNVTGNTRTGLRGALEALWEFPLSDQAGEYRCEVSGIDSRGHGVTLTATTNVVLDVPSVDDLVTYIHSQSIEIINLKAAVEELKHTEVGLASCGGQSNTWNTQGGHYYKRVGVQFSKPYTSTPNVHISLQYMDLNDGKELWFAIELKNVDQHGFTFQCRTWKHPNWLIDGMSVSWISVPQ